METDSTFSVGFGYGYRRFGFGYRRNGFKIRKLIPMPSSSCVDIVLNSNPKYKKYSRIFGKQLIFERAFYIYIYIYKALGLKHMHSIVMETLVVFIYGYKLATGEKQDN